MPVVDLLGFLVAGDLHLVGIHDHDEIASVDVRREGRLVLAAQGGGNRRCQATEGLALGVDNVPLALDLSRLLLSGSLDNE